MELKNGYKLIYEAVKGGVRSLYATKGAAPSDDDTVVVPDLATVKSYKLVYEKNGKICGSAVSYVTADDVEHDVKCGTDFLFIDNQVVEEEPEAEETEETPEAGETEETPEAGEEE